MDFHWAITTLERGGIIERPEGEFVLQYCKRGDHYAYRFRRRESDGPGSTWQETGFYRNDILAHTWQLVGALTEEGITHAQ